MHHKPVILVACLFGLAVSFAPIFNIAVFLKPLAAQFGWSRAQVSGGAALAMLAIAAVSPLIGRLIDRSGPRRVIIASCAAFSVSIALLSLNRGNYPLFVANVVLIGVAGAGTTPLAYLALVARWFDRRLGLALGITMMGIGLGLAAGPPIANHFLAVGGLSFAFQMMAVIAAFGVVNALLFLREPPGAAITHSLGMGRPPSPRPIVDDLRDLASEPQFWIIFFAMALMTVAVAGSAVHYVALMTDRGWGATEAAAAAGLIGISVMGGRLFAGVILDFLSIRLVGGITFTLGTAGVAMLAAGWGGVVPALAACCIGIAQGAEGDLLAYVVKRKFRPDIYGLTFGLFFMAFNLGAFSGPLIMGAAFDRHGSYAGALWGLVILGALATILIACITGAPGRNGPLRGSESGS